MQVRSLATRVPRWAPGAAMIGFVSALELEDLVDPVNLGTTAERLRQAAEHPGRMLAATLLLFISSVLLIPTVIGVLKLARRAGRGVRLASLAAGTWTVGALGHCTLVGYYIVLSAAAKHRSPAVVAVLDQTNHTAAVAIAGIGIACFVFGCLLTIGALVRSGIASRWLLLAIPAALLGQGVGKAIGLRAFDLGQLMGVSPLIWLGWRQLVDGHSPGSAPVADAILPPRVHASSAATG